MSYLGKDIKKLGFGLMRLPTIGEDVDIEQTKQMVDLFLESGFTYFDTAYSYHDGKSEEAVAAALTERYPRESYQLATKLPAWIASTEQEAKDMFWTSLKRTGAGYFDYYLLHNLGDTRTEAFDRFGIWGFLAEQKREGRIRHLGFSAHAKADFLDEVLSKHPESEFVQLQINYADWESDSIQSRKCYDIARAHGKPVIVMEPVKGGALAKLPESVSSILRGADSSASTASWAVRYAASLDGIVTVLSGMSSLEQMKDNVAFMKDFRPLTDSECAVIDRARQALSEFPQIPCTDCRYCLPGCPENVAIPGTLGIVNDYLIYRDLQRAKGNYYWQTVSRAKASACISCGKCEAVCPQSISIAAELKKAAELLEGK